MSADWSWRRDLLCALAAALAGLSGWAEEASTDSTNTRPWSVGAETSLFSQYLWRGLAYSAGWVVQPAVSVSAYDLTLCWWSNYELEEKTAPRRWNETDLTLTYARAWGPLELEAGVQSFLYPSPVPSPDTAEAVVKGACPVGPVAVWTRHAFDLAAYPGAYFGEAGLEWETALHPRLSGKACAGLGWGSARFNEAYAAWRHGALHVASLDLALAWQVSDHWRLGPRFGCSALLDASLRRQVRSPDRAWGGLTVSWEF